MKILPFVNSVPDDGQQRIQWIRNGDALMGASTKFGSDGNLNIATAQVQANVVVLDENLQELNLGFDANTQKIQEIEALLEASGSLDLVQTVQTNTTDIEQLKLDSAETKSRLTSVETETNANKTMLGDTGPNFVGTVNSEIEFLKARIGNNINETVNGTPNQGAPATGVKLSINNIIAELNSVKQSNTELNNKVDLYDVPTLKSGIAQIRTELGPTPVSKPPVYTMLDSLTNDSSTFSTDIETIKSKIAFNNPNSIDARVGSLENDHLTLENTVNGPDGLTTHMSVVESEIDLLNPAVDTLQTQVANIDTSLSGADGLSQQVQEIKAHVGIVPNGEVAPPTSLEGRFVTLKDIQNDTSSTVQDLQVDVLDLRTDVDKKASIDQLNAIGAGHKAYLTLAAAQAAQATFPANSIIEVTNDLTASNNGTYQWNGTTLTKSVYDPLTQAKGYTDGKLLSFSTRSGYLGGYSTENGLMLLGFRASDGRPIFGNGGDFITELETQKGKFDQSIEVVSANPRSGILGGIKTPSGMLLISFDAKTGKPILAGVDVIQEIENLKNNGSSSEAKVQFLPNNHLAGWGDSLTGAGSSGDWLSKLAANIGLSYYNGGIGGQGSKSIAARQGAVPVLFNAFTIPAATTAVAVTLKNEFSPCSSGGAAQQLTVNSIVGNLVRDSSGNHTFTRLVAGSDVAVPQGAPGYSVLGETYSKSLQFVGTGRNSFSNMTPAEIVATVSAMINNQRTQIKRFIVWSFPYFPSDSSTQKANVDAVNNALKTAFPQYFVDIKNWLCTTSPVTFGSTTINDPFTVLSITPTSQDLTDAAAGLTPISLRASETDGHFNQNCGTAIAYRMQRELEIKGWI